jgi:hypothetical protein
MTASQSPNGTPIEWEQWLSAGWHHTSAVEWAETWLPKRLTGELALLEGMAAENPIFEGVLQRERRNTVDRLIRFQYHLPWASKSLPPFARELGSPRDTDLELEHAIPVKQLRTFVLMAIDTGNLEEAKRRLKFSWLCPMVLASQETHRAISKGPNRLCHDFLFPFGRYSGRMIEIYNGQKIPAEKYGLRALLQDLAAIETIKPIVKGLDEMRFPSTAEENQRTRAAVVRNGHKRRRAPSGSRSC